MKAKNLLFDTNGAIAFQMAIKALDLKGELLTTPFSFGATTSSIVWEGCKAVFGTIRYTFFAWLFKFKRLQTILSLILKHEL